MANTGKDRRQMPRVNCPGAMVKYERKAGFFKGLFGKKEITSDLLPAEDISGSGMRFEADEALDPGTLLRLRIKLGEDVSTLSVKGKVIWQSGSQGTHDYHVGIEFQDVSDQTQNKINAAVQALMQSPDAFSGAISIGDFPAWREIANYTEPERKKWIKSLKGSLLEGNGVMVSHETRSETHLVNLMTQRKFRDLPIIYSFALHTNDDKAGDLGKGERVEFKGRIKEMSVGAAEPGESTQVRVPGKGRIPAAGYIVISLRQARI